jgi:hypothetical protein
MGEAQLAGEIWSLIRDGSGNRVSERGNNGTTEDAYDSTDQHTESQDSVNEQCLFLNLV